MKPILDIITVTKDDLEGVAATILSTRKLRACLGVRQIIVDSSSGLISEKVKDLLIGEERVNYFWQKPNGIAAAFNLGVSSSSAEWTWFLNGRDEAHPDLDVSFLMQILNSSQAEILVFQLELKQSRSRLKHPALWALWPPIYWVPHPATLIRSKLFEQYGVYNNNFRIAMDADLWMRLFSRDIVIDMLSIPVVLYDQHGVSSTNSIEIEKEAKRLIRNNMGMLAKMWVGRGVYLFKLFFFKH
jgi:glycosyltransferase involved in cell wall biosynthesis